MIGQLGLETGSSVLDMACGTGLNFDLLQRAVGGSGRIVGVDNSAKTLELARRRVSRRGWRNVELIESDAADYRPAERFDAAVCTFAVDIIPRWRETIAMMVDAVGPGGRVGFIGFTERSREGVALVNWAWRVAARLFGGELDRPVRAVVRAACNEISYEEVFGGFYYLLVGAVADAPDGTR
ncbi:MAG: class I SAM-dependent methyltransferase [Actinomycetota bacterium]